MTIMAATDSLNALSAHRPSNRRTGYFSSCFQVSLLRQNPQSHKNRKFFTVYKCINDSCRYYLSNKKKLPKDLKDEDKYLYKLHYIYREFKLDFFRMDLHSLPKNATSFNFRKFNPHI